MFVGVCNDIPAAKPHASPRLKILMAHHWCCRVTPRTLVLEKSGVKVQEGLCEVQNENVCPKRRLAPGVPISEA